MLAHLASKEGIVAAENAMGGSSKVNYDVVPAAIFTSPEIGSVGIREKQATEKGINYKVGKFQFRGLGKAHAMGEISGLFKIISDADTDKILGAHIIGAHASDLVHEIAVAMDTWGDPDLMAVVSGPQAIVDIAVDVGQRGLDGSQVSGNGVRDEHEVAVHRRAADRF